MLAEIARPPFSLWLSCHCGIGANWSFANICHSFGLVWGWQDFSLPRASEYLGLGRRVPWETWVFHRPTLLWECVRCWALSPCWDPFRAGLGSGWLHWLCFSSPPTWRHAGTEEAKLMRSCSWKHIWVLSLLIKRWRLKEAPEGGTIFKLISFSNWTDILEDF